MGKTLGSDIQGPSYRPQPFRTAEDDERHRSDWNRTHKGRRPYLGRQQLHLPGVRGAVSAMAGVYGVHKRYLNGPKLAGELSGPAKRLILGKPSGWFSHPRGVNDLLNYLRSCLGRPQIAELSDFLNKYFRQGRRKAGESMSDYVTRKCELYLRAQQSLQRVLPHHSKIETASESVDGWTTGQHRERGRRASWDSAATQESTTTTSSNPAAPVAATTTAEEEGYQTWQDNHCYGWNQSAWWGGQHSWSSWDDWGYQGWYSYPWYGSAYGNTYYNSKNDQVTTPLTEILPDFVQAWYMLQDSGLDVHDRNLVQTAVGSNFSLQRVSQELRTQWPDHELKRRDQGQRHSGYWGEQPETSGEEEAEEYHDRSYWMDQGMTEEGLAAMDEAAGEIQRALAVMQTAKRTLKEARAKQEFVKLSRKYYGNNRHSASSSQRGRPQDDSQMQCLKCGKIGHRAVNCPDKANKQETQHAPFVRFGDMDIAWATRTGMTTEEAINEGMAVVDGGATKTLGSIAAVEQLMAKNREQRGHDGVRQIDTTNRPVFSFGNSSKNRCASTVQMMLEAAGKPDHLQIHTLAEGTGPILLSVETLRTLKAVIDFENDVIVFRALDPRKLVPVARSATGHQLLPLASDLFKNAWATSRDVPSLLEYRAAPTAE